jgi:hypothetical protein
MYICFTKRELLIEDSVPQASHNQREIPNNLAILEISDWGEYEMRIRWGRERERERVIQASKS